MKMIKNHLILLFSILLGNCIYAQNVNKEERPNYLEVNGSKLQYVVEGQGIPCLVIGSSIYYPRTFPSDLREHLKMYFVDLKWFAKNYEPENLDSVNIQSIVQDVEEIRQKLGLNRTLIMGHSIHGTIAMEYVKTHPEKVSGLIVIGSPCEWGKVKELDRLTGQEEASARYNNMSPQYWYNPSYDASWLWKGMTVHSEVTRHLFTKVFHNYNMFEPAITINVPVFVGIGKYDYVIPYTLWESTYKSIPDFCDNYVDQEVNKFLKSEGGWFILNLHGLDKEGWGPVSTKYLDSLLKRLIKIDYLTLLPTGEVLKKVGKD